MKRLPLQWMRCCSSAAVLAGLTTTMPEAMAQSFGFIDRLVATMLPDPRCVAPPKYEFTKSSSGQLSLGIALASIVKSADIKLQDGRTTQSVFESQRDNPAALIAAISVYYTTCLIVVASNYPPERKAEILSSEFSKIIGQLPPAPPEKKSRLDVPLNGVVRVSGPSNSARGTTSEETGAALTRLTAALPEKIAWQKRWFRRNSDGTALTGGGCWHVIVASPLGERAAELELARYNLRFPGIFFELWQKDGNPHYAVTAGIGLDRSDVPQLMEALAGKGIRAKDAFSWRWPGEPAPACTS